MQTYNTGVVFLFLIGRIEYTPYPLTRCYNGANLQNKK